MDFVLTLPFSPFGMLRLIVRRAQGEEQFPGFPKPLIQELDLQMPLLNLESSQGQLEEK